MLDSTSFAKKSFYIFHLHRASLLLRPTRWSPNCKKLYVAKVFIVWQRILIENWKNAGNEVLSFYSLVHIQQKLLARDTSVIMWWILKKFWKAGENISFTSSTPAWLDGKLSKRFMGKISARNSSTDFPKVYCEKETFAHIMMQWHFKIIESPFKSMLEIKCNFKLSLFGCDI